MKKLMTFLSFILLFFITACSSKIVNEEFTIIFDSAGGNYIPTQIIKRGKLISKPEDPEREYHEFTGWYLEDVLFDFDTIVSQDTTLTAHWEEIFNNYGMNVIELSLADTTISQSGLYTSMEEVGSYIYTFHTLPSNFKTKSEFNRLNYSSENKLSVGGDVFYNREGLLPSKEGRTFTECDIDYTGGARGAKRIVFSSDFLIFYTKDHYSSFYILKFI